MSFIGWGIAAGGLLLFNKLARLGDSAKNLLTDITGVKFLGIGSGQANFEVRYRASNPGRADINIDFIQADISVSESKIAAIRQESKDGKPLHVIPAGQTVTLPIKVSAGIMSLGPALLAAITGGIPQDITVSGFVRANGLRSEFSSVTKLTK